MRFIVRSPFRHGPKRIHHSARPVGKFIGEPPLIAEGRVSASRKPLKVRDPVVRTVGRFLVCRVSCPGVVQRFDSRESRTMTIAALIGHVTAEILEAASLFGCNCCAMYDVLGPLRRSLHPLNQFARMLAPIGVFIGMEQYVARK